MGIQEQYVKHFIKKLMVPFVYFDLLWYISMLPVLPVKSELFLNFFLVCLRIWLWLFFKIFFTQKCIKIIKNYFLKIIFDIITSK